jgi:transcriptional regulator with XRE-family HTH domain
LFERETREAEMVIAQRRSPELVDPALWKRTDMRTALASRDIARVFKLLQRVGVSQRRIAALTGQSQSEISEILGGRHVVSYDVLARIADGLGVPRGSLGLAYDDATAALVGAAPATEEATPEDPVRMLARLTQLTVGSATVDPLTWAQPFPLSWGPAPEHIGPSDVARLAELTEQLRALDREHGGGSCRELALANLTWAQQMLRAQAEEQTTGALHRAIADLHVVAGWTSFDVGILGPARRHFARALEHARFAEEPSLVAKVLYCMGRLHLHHGWAVHALRLFQLGQLSAQESGLGRAVALLHGNLAWGYSLIGDGRAARACIGRARDEFGRSDGQQVPPWLAFVDTAEISALRGSALAHLPDPTKDERQEAIDRFSISTALRELPWARSRAFELSALAWLLVDNGEVENGVQVGHESVDVASNVRSQRVIDRMAPLRTSLARHRSNPQARDLADRIAELKTTAGPLQAGGPTRS